MSALLYTSPRSSPAPAGEPFTHPHRHQPHPPHPMARHQVAFGQSHQQQSLSGTPFGASSASPSSSASAASPVQNASTGVSSFGFGFASGASYPQAGSSASASGSSFYGKLPPTSSASPFRLPANAVMPAAGPSSSTSPSRRRRRRSDSPDERDMEGLQPQSHHNRSRDDASSSDPTTSGKRIRRELKPMNSSSTLSTHASAQPAQSLSSNDFDVGKALASLSKPALLSVITSLLATQPSLKPIVLSLLPAPSLESFTSTLHVAEKKVLDAVPVGRNLRDEYIWSRIRAPLEEYIAEARLALTQFCPSSSQASEQDAGAQQQHPATIFAFLYTLTLSIRKLEVLLPRAPLPFGSSTRLGGSGNSSPHASINNPSSLNQNDPLVCFLPALINQWHVLVTKLSNLVNQNGRVLSAEMVRTWFKQLDSLVDVDLSGIQAPISYSVENDNDASSVGRKAVEAVRERFVKELGWLIGIRTPASSVTQAQGGQGGIQAVANQFMDSRMMMTENDESDDEL